MIRAEISVPQRRQVTANNRFSCAILFAPGYSRSVRFEPLPSQSTVASLPTTSWKSAWVLCSRRVARSRRPSAASDNAARRSTCDDGTANSHHARRPGGWSAQYRASGGGFSNTIVPHWKQHDSPADRCLSKKLDTFPPAGYSLFSWLTWRML